MAAGPIKSMTGFAQARVEQDGWALTVSLRSVNHRFLDLHMKLPEGFEIFEPRIRQALRDSLRRGHIDVGLRYQPAESAPVQLNREVAAGYVRAAQQLCEQFGLANEPDIVALLRLPGVVEAGGLPAGMNTDQLQEPLDACLREALGRLEEMRTSEGRALSEEIIQRLRKIGEHTDRIERLAERVRPAYARRLESRLKELLGGAALDPARIVQEAAILAERSDISEEIARLRSHNEQFQKLLRSGGEVGKKLDFLLQEMQREANTMLSKTPGVEAEGLDITELALAVKAEIEKLREQAQNVE